VAKKAPTKAERDHMGRVVEMGCFICRMPCEYHHILTGAGMGQRASHYDGFGLCPNHHRLGGYGVAIHAGIKEWEKNFGSELDMLEKVRELLL